MNGMRVRVCRALLVLSCVGSLTAGASAAQWADEFNGNGAPWSGNWNIEVGGGGWGNNELQYYRDGGNNAWQYGGRLQIQAKRENFGGRAYTSARINTAGKRSFGPYGYMQARLQGPMGQGLWPAFWMLGTNIGSVGWPACGEIDIMEHVNTSSNVLGTIHWNAPNGYAYYSAMNTGISFASYHVYSIYWDASRIVWQTDYVDRGSANIQGNVNSTEEFHRPMFAILNLAVGGNWPGAPNASTPFPANFNIDWIAWN
jgi:beta-glucanase (GH16 family)